LPARHPPEAEQRAAGGPGLVHIWSSAFSISLMPSRSTSLPWMVTVFAA
jgi:hypothetical protein